MDSMFLFITVFLALQIILMLWAWYDIYKNKVIKTDRKVFFALLVFGFPVLGPIAYFHFKNHQLKKRGFLSTNR